MSESSRGETVQRDLLRNEIERKIPRVITQSSPGQTTLDNWMDKINNPGIEIEVIREKLPEKKSPKRRPWDKLVIAKGTRDEHTMLGRYYTPPVGIELWSLPKERRDAIPKLKIEEGDVVFQEKGSDVWENQVKWTRVIAIAKQPTGERSIRGYGYARWEEINRN